MKWDKGIRGDATAMKPCQIPEKWNLFRKTLKLKKYNISAGTKRPSFAAKLG